MSHIIGFANKFYTLWDYQKEVHYSTTADYKHVATGVTHKYFYIKNISTDIDKVKSLYPNVGIDDSLKGKVRSWEHREKIDYPTEYFPYGRLEGELIMEATDVWQLNRLYEESDVRRKALARRRLVQLGELVRYDWIEPIYDYNEATNTHTQKGEKKHKYISKEGYDRKIKELKRLEEVSKSEFVFNDGDRVKVRVKKVSSFGFDTNYGYCHVITYQSDDNKKLIYKGNTPPDIQDEFYTITATIKHNEYKGEKQTLLQRIKVA